MSDEEKTQEIKPGTISPDTFMAMTTGPTLDDWQRVALGKWEHYIYNVLPSRNNIAILHHEHGLLKLIPFLLGRPDLQITPEMEEKIHNLDYDPDGPHLEFSRTGMPAGQAEAVRELLERRIAKIPEPEFRREYEQNPHSQEDRIKPYPRSSLDFGPSELKQGDVPLYPDAG